MKGRQVILDRVEGREAAALLLDGTLDDFLIQPPCKSSPLPGAIFLAVADRALKGTGGQFVRLPNGKHGFLRSKTRYEVGSRFPVQISTYAELGKAPPCSDRILLKGSFVIVTPGAKGINFSRAIANGERKVHLKELAAKCFVPRAGDAGLVFRTASATATDDEVEKEIAELICKLHRIAATSRENAPELLVDAPTPHQLAQIEWIAPLASGTLVETSFDECGIQATLLQFLSSTVSLPHGASMTIEETRAVVAVDVNSGSDASIAACLKANLAAIEALPRQLRIRGLGGQVVVDLAPLSKRNRPVVEKALANAFKGDAVPSDLAGWTPLGNFELKRKRERFPLKEGILQ